MLFRENVCRKYMAGQTGDTMTKHLIQKSQITTWNYMEWNGDMMPFLQKGKKRKALGNHKPLFTFLGVSSALKFQQIIKQYVST